MDYFITIDNNQYCEDMKVLHICSAHSNSGAGIAALNSHKDLIDKQVDSRLLFLTEDLSVERTYCYSNNFLRRIKRYIVTFLDRLPVLFYNKRSSTLFSPGVIGVSLRYHPLVLWADVVHIHWANHGFVRLSEMKLWNKPVVWTLRDMWALTGGCHQSFECDSFMVNCGKCPSLGSVNDNDLSRFCYNRKRSVFETLDISWVAISTWMQRKALESNIVNTENIHIIPSGVSELEFYIKEGNSLRIHFGFKPNDTIILCGAGNLRSSYKGFRYMVDCLNKLPETYKVLTFGTTTFTDEEISQEFRHVGMVDSDQLVDIYNTSDLFLAPSIAEAMGKTIAEAQLCGLPVVCFENTGPEDIVLHKETGYIAKYKDVKDLCIGVQYCLNTRFDRQAVRNQVKSKFSISSCSLQYISLYENLMARSNC